MYSLFHIQISLSYFSKLSFYGWFIYIRFKVHTFHLAIEPLKFLLSRMFPLFQVIYLLKKPSHMGNRKIHMLGLADCLTFFSVTQIIRNCKLDLEARLDSDSTF